MGLWVCVTIAVPLLNIDDGNVLSNIMQQSECTIKISLGMHQSIPAALDGKFPGVATKKGDKCPILRQHCNIFHWLHSQIVQLELTDALAEV